VPESNQIEAAVAAIRGASTWDQRVARIRRVPEDFGVARHKDVYSRIAAEIYVPDLGPDFAYVHWRDEYELAPFRTIYRTAYEATNGFSDVGVADLERALTDHPESLVVFRTLVGFTQTEFAESTKALPRQLELPTFGKGTVKSMEEGRRPRGRTARSCAEVIPSPYAGAAVSSRPRLADAAQAEQARHRRRMGIGATLRH
jgi:hypothetical protein